MTLEDSPRDAPNGSPKTWQNIEDAAEQSAHHDDFMTDKVEAQLLISDVAITEIESDYGDFTSDEEAILNHLLENIASPSSLIDAPLLITDIEDYEEPRELRLPKVLGVERSIPFWLSKVQLKNQDQTIRNGAFSHIESSGSREAQGNSQRRHAVPEEHQVEHPQLDRRSPLERFRHPPQKVLSVTDLVSPAWCELQYFYTLSKHGRKKQTPAMKQGTKIHKAREEEVHTTVPVDITTREDQWGLRIWNVIQGLRTLRDTGRTRELEIWGMMGGEIVNGIVDELSYDCPDPKLEAQVDERYANAGRARQELPEYQASIREYLISPASRGSQSISETSNPGTTTENREAMPPPPVPGKQKGSMVYITDIKTRSVKNLPAGASIRPTIMQLHLYHHMLENLTHDNFPLQALADRYELDTKSTFSDSFIVQVGSLNQELFDTATEQLGASEDKVTASQIASSQDSINLLLRHNNLSSLWSFMIQQFQETFLLSPEFSLPGTPSSTPRSIHDAPTSSTRLSPILTATYLSSKTSELLGSKSILFDASLLKDYLEEVLSWWKGERSARGVELAEAWKCRSCDFRDDCSWIHERDAAAVGEAKARKTIQEVAGAEANMSKSEI